MAGGLEGVRARLLPLGYLLSTLVTCGALVANGLLVRYLEGNQYFLSLAAVLVSAWLAGWKGGILSALLGGIITTFLYVPPRFGLLPVRKNDFIRLAIYLLTSAAVIWLSASVRASKNVSERRLREVEAAMKLRDEFLLVAGHELKTPLTTIKLQLTSVKAAAQPSVSILRKVNVVERQLTRLVQLTNELIDVTRISAGRITLNVEEVDLCKIVRDAAVQLEVDLRHSGSSLHLELPTAMVGQWDPQRIEHIVTNLLSNAIKYGEGKPISVSVEAMGGSAHLVVRDHGMGIKPEDRERVFERFERAVSPHKYGGLGLGLWIVREFCRAHNGRVRIESTPGQGSTFIVELPLARELCSQSQ